MKIAICDDDKIFRQKIKEILIAYRNNNRFEINIYEFESGNQFLEAEHIFDMVFLDYQMPGLDGMETARKLRKKNNICNIIFITNYPEFVLESFMVQPFRFIVKPLEESKILEAMDSYIKQQNLFYPICVIEDGELKTICSQDIMYLQGDGKYCWIYTTKDIFHSSKTLTQIHALLPPHCFFRVHKSYVVNMFSINSIKGNIITLNNGEHITIGRVHISNFKKAYSSFLKNNYVRL